mgnify:CR=1 FL=1|tara:strand:+ start:22 stop:867 length:846 start_codon:yes stop_codon:yes gene_type:complete
MKKILFYSIAFTTLISCAANKYHYFDYQSVPLANQSEIKKCEQVFVTLLNNHEVVWYDVGFDEDITTFLIDWDNWDKDSNEAYWLFAFTTNTFEKDVLKLLDYEEHKYQRQEWLRLINSNTLTYAEAEEIYVAPGYFQYVIENTFNITTNFGYEKLSEKLIFTQNIPTIDEEIKIEGGVKKPVYWVIQDRQYLIDDPAAIEIFSNFDIGVRDLIIKDGFDYDRNFETFSGLDSTHYFEIMVHNHFLSIKDESALKLCTIMNDRSAFNSSIYSDYLEDSLEE